MKNLYHFLKFNSGQFVWREKPKSRKDSLPPIEFEPYIPEQESTKTVKPIIPEIEFPQFSENDENLSWDKIVVGVKKAEKKEFEEKVEKAQKELKENGITSEQKEAYNARLSDRLYKNVTPRHYKIFRATKQFIDGPDETREVSSISDLDIYRKWRKEEITREEYHEYKKKTTMGEDDAWALFLGIPQKYGTFSISKYKPSKSKDDIYYYSTPRYENEMLNFFLGAGTLEFSVSDKKMIMAFRNYTMSKGEDENGHYASYYDTFDLHPLGIDAGGVVGKKFEVYNRIYYDPKTEERIDVD